MNGTVIRLSGVYQDIIITGNGAVRQFGWRSNLVVDRCRTLLAALMRGERMTSGIRFMLLGRGLPEWDERWPGSPRRNDEQLVDPQPRLVRVRRTDIRYLDADGSQSSTPTSRVEVRVTIRAGTPPVPEGETSYPLREFGLFGRLGPELAMIDYVRHRVIHKGADDTLERTVRLVF